MQKTRLTAFVNLKTAVMLQEIEQKYNWSIGEIVEFLIKYYFDNETIAKEKESSKEKEETYKEVRENQIRKQIGKPIIHEEGHKVTVKSGVTGKRKG